MEKHPDHPPNLYYKFIGSLVSSTLAWTTRGFGNSLDGPKVLLFVHSTSGFVPLSYPNFVYCKASTSQSHIVFRFTIRYQNWALIQSTSHLWFSPLQPSNDTLEVRSRVIRWKRAKVHDTPWHTVDPKFSLANLHYLNRAFQRINTSIQIATSIAQLHLAASSRVPAGAQ